VQVGIFSEKKYDTEDKFQEELFKMRYREMAFLTEYRCTILPHQKYRVKI